MQGAQGQSTFVQSWINLWVRGVNVNPHLFAIAVALAETSIAFGLLSGFMTRTALIGGMMMSIIIWTTAEGFGGPYAPGSTDIGAAIIYLIVFIALWIGKSWRHYSIDALLHKRLPSYGGK